MAHRLLENHCGKFIPHIWLHDPLQDTNTGHIQTFVLLFFDTNQRRLQREEMRITKTMYKQTKKQHQSYTILDFFYNLYVYSLCSLNLKIKKKIFFTVKRIFVTLYNILLVPVLIESKQKKILNVFAFCRGVNKVYLGLPVNVRFTYMRRLRMNSANSWRFTVITPCATQLNSQVFLLRIKLDENVASSFGMGTFYHMSKLSQNKFKKKEEMRVYIIRFADNT